MNLSKYSLFCLIATTALLFPSCKKETTAHTEIQKTTQTDSVVTPDVLLKPIKVYSNDTVSVKAYEYDGLKYYLNKSNDTTYVVNFWATWCVPCVAELPNFEKINEKYKNDKIKVILVSLDMAKMVETKLLPFIYKKQLKSEVLFMHDPDQNTWLPKVDTTWSGALPATLIYNKDKRRFYEKSFTYEELEKEISNFK